jgi:hypothetical protein
VVAAPAGAVVADVDDFELLLHPTAIRASAVTVITLAHRRR